MPSPVSLTCTNTTEPSRYDRTETVPPVGVNFTAFDVRFQTICCKRPASAVISSVRSGTSTRRVTPLAFAAGVTASTAPAIASPMLAGPSDNDSFLLTMRDTSSTSSMRRACALAFRSMIASGRSSPSGCFLPRRMTVQPRIAFSGVLSSWETVAKNSSFARFAPSASCRSKLSRTRASSRSLKDMAVSIAIAARAANSSAKARSSGV